MIIQAHLRCNIEVPRRICCEYHAVGSNLRSLAQMMLSRQCFRGAASSLWQADGIGGQCVVCGALALATAQDGQDEEEASGECSFCGERMALGDGADEAGTSVPPAVRYLTL